MASCSVGLSLTTTRSSLLSGWKKKGFRKMRSNSSRRTLVLRAWWPRETSVTPRFYHTPLTELVSNLFARIGLSRETESRHRLNKGSRPTKLWFLPPANEPLVFWTFEPDVSQVLGSFKGSFNSTQRIVLRESPIFSLTEAS